MICPRCEGQEYDVDSCGLCGNTGYLDDGPADCPGMGIDDLCTWPDVEGCGLCVIGKNPAVYATTSSQPGSGA